MKYYIIMITKVPNRSDKNVRELINKLLVLVINLNVNT
jgi:hypothetical protein